MEVYIKGGYFKVESKVTINIKDCYDMLRPRPISESYKEVLLSTGRNGMEELLDFMENNGFYKAPASTKHHQNWEGGLAEHDFNVFKKLSFLNSKLNLNFHFDEMAISALLHDICKIDCYIIQEDKTIIWNENAKPGHGKKSVEIIEQFINLTQREREAITYHMGAYEKKEFDWNELSSVYRKNPLAYYIHVADMKDTYGF